MVMHTEKMDIRETKTGSQLMNVSVAVVKWNYSLKNYSLKLSFHNFWKVVDWAHFKHHMILNKNTTYRQMRKITTSGMTGGNL